jgi:hypothetical protein
LRPIAGEHADGREADLRATEIEAARARRLIEIAADTGESDRPLGIGEGEVIERLLDALRAIVVGVAVRDENRLKPESISALTAPGWLLT